MDAQLVTECPYCKGDVSENASKCRHCGEWLTESRPRAAREPLVSARGMGEAAIKGVAFFVVAVFVLAMLGFFFAGGG